MANSILGIGASGLAAAQLGLQTAGHNIANVNTPGYSRQETVQAAATPQFTGAGFVGNGVQVITIRRDYSAFLDAEIRRTQSASSYYDTLSTGLQAIDNLVADPQAGLGPALTGFFNGVNTVSANPGDPSARQALLSGAQALADRFRSLDGAFADARNNIGAQLASSVQQANGYTAQIANLNARISVVSSSSGGGQTPNDLLDQRDQLVNDLAKLVPVSVVKQDDGSYNVFAGNGQALVVGFTSRALTVTADPADPQNAQVAIQGAGNTLIPLRAADIPGGRIGGLLAFREQSLDPAQNALGRIAIAVASGFNDQNKLGMDLNGALGGDVFTFSGPRVVPNANNPAGGTLSASIVDYTALTTSDYKVAYDGSNYTVTRLADNTAWTYATLPQTVDGVQFTGAAVAGSSYLVQPTRAGACDLTLAIGDVNKIAAAAPILGSASTANTGRGTITAGTVNAPPPADPNLLAPVTITFTGPNTYSVSGTGTGNPSGLAYTPGMTVTYNGWSVVLDGAPATGDVFNVGSNAGGVSGDNRNALALAALQTTNLVAGKTATLAGAIGQMVSDVGNQTNAAQSGSTSQASLLNDATAARASVSGVNLDEEAANLLRYQQAYQAAGKLIGISGTLFDQLISMFH